MNARSSAARQLVSSGVREADRRPDEVLRAIRGKGAQLWVQDGQLRYRAPRGALEPEDVEALRSFKAQIVALLERSGEAPEWPVRDDASSIRRAPLTFAQLTHWRLYSLGERRAARQIASATRLRGHLNLEAMQKSVDALVARHDALRTRVVLIDGHPVQEVGCTARCVVDVRDLSALPEHRWPSQIGYQIEELILEPIDVAEAPLLGVRLLRLGDCEHVLIVAIEHIVSDGASLGVFMRELFSAYAQVLTSGAIALPPVQLQFPDHALAQERSLQSWLAKHWGFWSERIASMQRLRFPEEPRAAGPAHAGWGVLPFRIEADTVAQLQEWCRAQRTTLVMGVFTAYVALVLRWCDASDSIVQFQSDGRANPAMENAIGFFAVALYVRTTLRDDDTFVSLMQRLMREYCEAYEHTDSSYLKAQASRPGFSRNTTFNWIASGLPTESTVLDSTGHELACSPIRFVHPLAKRLNVDCEPSMVLSWCGQGEIAGELWFPNGRFTDPGMQRFVDNFLMFIQAMLANTGQRVKDTSLA